MRTLRAGLFPLFRNPHQKWVIRCASGDPKTSTAFPPTVNLLWFEKVPVSWSGIDDNRSAPITNISILQPNSNSDSRTVNLIIPLAFPQELLFLKFASARRTQLLEEALNR